MAILQVREGGGGPYYATLNAALSNANPSDEIQIIDQWTGPDTTNCNVSDSDLLIITVGDSRHPGHPNGGGPPSHYRHRVNSGHAFTINTAGAVTIDGLDIGSQSNGVSDEVIRVNSDNSDLTIKNSLLWFGGVVSQQDAIYCNGRSADNANINLENTMVFNAGRSGIGVYRALDVTLRLNSSTFYKCGGISPAEDRAGCVGASSAEGTLAAISFNCLFHEENSELGPVYCGSTPSYNQSANIADRCMVYSSTIALVTETDCEYDKIFTDSNASPAVIFNNVSGPTDTWDLRLQDDPNQEAKDGHSDPGGDADAGFLSIPATDIVGTSRVAPYEYGSFTISADIPVIHEFEFNVSGDSVTSDITVDVTAVIEFAFDVSGDSQTSDIDVSFVIEFEFTGQGDSETSDITVTITAEINFSFDVSGDSQTSDITVEVAAIREFSFDVSGDSQTSDIGVSKTAFIGFNVSGDSQTSSINVAIAGIVDFAFLSSGDSLTTDIEILKEALFSFIVNGISRTSDIDLEKLVDFSLDVSGDSETSAILASIIKEYAFNVSGDSQTKDIFVETAAVVYFSITGQGDSQTSDITANVLRELGLDVIGDSRTSDIEVTRLAVIEFVGQGDSRTSNIDVFVTTLVEFLFDVAGNSETADIDINVLRDIIAIVVGRSDTSNIIVGVDRPLVFTALGASQLSDILVAISVLGIITKPKITEVADGLFVVELTDELKVNELGDIYEILEIPDS